MLQYSTSVVVGTASEAAWRRPGRRRVPACVPIHGCPIPSLQQCQPGPDSNVYGPVLAMQRLPLQRSSLAGPPSRCRMYCTMRVHAQPLRLQMQSQVALGQNKLPPFPCKILRSLPKGLLARQFNICQPRLSQAACRPAPLCALPQGSCFRRPRAGMQGPAQLLLLLGLPLHWWQCIGLTPWAWELPLADTAGRAAQYAACQVTQGNWHSPLMG